MLMLKRNNFKIFARLLRISKCSNSCLSDLRFTSFSNNLAHRNGLSTLAHSYESNWKNSPIKENVNVSNKTIDSQKIDDMLLTIDNNIRRTGRTVLSQVESVFEAVTKHGNATQAQSLYILRSCGFLHFELPSQRVEFIHKIWATFESLGLEFNVKHYNALLKVYIGNNHMFSPAELLVSMENQGIDPNLETYCYLIEKYCEDGNINGANEILECIKEKRITINEAIFNSLIKGHMKINDTSGAKEIMEAMRNSNILPSADTYSTLACGFVEQGNLESVEEIIIQANGEGVPLQNSHYIKIIFSAAPYEKNSDFIDKILNILKNTSDWSQNFINAAINLIHKDLDKVAFKLVLASSDSENNSNTNLFVKQLVKSDKPAEKIVQYCREIYDSQLNYLIFLNSAKSSIDLGKYDLAFVLFKEMQNKGMPVRLHYLKPIFLANKHSSEGMWKVVQNMYALGLPIDFFSYVDYVLPAVSATGPPEKLISQFQESGQSVSSFIEPLFHHYCFLGDLENALYLTERYPIQVNAYFDFEHFLSLYQEFDKKPTTYFKILKYILENMHVPGQDSLAIRGKKLAFFLQYNPTLFEEFHKSFIGQGCAYHYHTLEICKNILRKNAPSFLNLIYKLENREQKLKSSNYSKQPTLMEEISMHIKNRDIDKLNSSVSKFEEAGIVVSPLVLSQMLSLYCEVFDLDAAGNVLKKLKETYPNFKIESAKLFDYARNLLQFSKTDEAINVIKNECKEINNFSGIDMLQKSMRRFLNSCVQTGDVDLVKTVRNLLMVHADSFHLKEILLEPVLKIYLYRHDLEGSLNEFNNCVINHHFAPCLSLMLKKFILAEDQTKLQYLVDLASTCEGRNKVLHELAFACVELERLEQAKSVMLNLERNINSNLLEEYAKTLFAESKVTVLEGLLYAIADLTVKSKQEIYIMLLKLYSKKNNYQKMNQVLNLLKKENLDLSDESKHLVNQLFLKNNLPLPFESNNKITTTDEKRSSNFLKALYLKNDADSLNELKKMAKGDIRSLTVKEMSDLIDLLVEKDSLLDLSTNVYAISYIIENADQVFKPLLEKYSEQGNVEAMVSLANVFPDFSLKRSSFNTFLAKAFIVSNRPEDLLTELENRWDKKSKLFSTFAFEELLKIPHLEERTLKLAKKYLDVNFTLPLAVLWAHSFIEENYEKANEISQIHTIPVDKIDSIVLRHVRRTQNISMGEKYTEFVSLVNAKDRSKERAYGTLLDLLVSMQMYDQAVQLVLKAKSKHVDLEKHYRATLVTLENFLKKDNQSVPFEISKEATLS